VSVFWYVFDFNSALFQQNTPRQQVYLSACALDSSSAGSVNTHTFSIPRVIH